VNINGKIVGMSQSNVTRNDTKTINDHLLGPAPDPVALRGRNDTYVKICSCYPYINYNIIHSFLLGF
jgi:hypothetical protein